MTVSDHSVSKNKCEFLIKSLPVIICLIICCRDTPLLAQNTIVLHDHELYTHIGNRCEIFEDKTGSIDINSITDRLHSVIFSTIADDTPNFGFTRSVYWIKFTVTNAAPFQIVRLLEINFPLLDRIDLLIYTAGTRHHTLLKNKFTSGREIPFAERQINHRNFVFPFTISPAEELTFYIRIKTDDGMIFPMTIWEKDSFFKKVQQEYILFGIYYGIILVMILYNFFIFIFTKDSNYLIYILYITAFGLFQMAMNGLAIQFLWPDNTWWGITANPFLIGLSCVFASYFSLNFLNMKEYTPLLSHVMKLLIIAGALLAIASLFVSYHATILAGQIIPVAMVLIAIPAAVICLKKGNRSARFYLVAWTMFFAGILLSAFRIIGLLPHNFLTEHGIQMGSGLEAILLSIALADRINIMKKEKDDAQGEVIRSQNIMMEQLQKSRDEIVETNRQLVLSEERYRLLIEGSSDIIFTLDEDLKFITANNAIAAELKLNPETIQGLDFFDIIYTDTGRYRFNAVLVRQQLEEFTQTKKPVFFRTQLISPISTEPKEMQIQLEYINIEGKNEILGKASSLIDDSLMIYLESEHQTFIIENYLLTADDVIHRITKYLDKHTAPETAKLIRIALKEIIINAIEHGNLGITFQEKSDTIANNSYFELLRERQETPVHQNKKVHIDYSINDHKVIYIISDEGDGFNYEPYLTDSEDTEIRFIFHGLGITMAKNAFDEISYNHKGNEVILVKYFKNLS